jgi:lipoprotein NlpD
MNRFFWVLLIAVSLTACESNPPAPVIERAPSKPAPPTKPSTTSKPGDSKTPVAKDWRPDSYVVKKGDTLYSIGLEFGYDYKEIATANNIAPPYAIKIGQKLSFSGLNSKTGAATTEAKPMENEDGVVVSPIKTETAGAYTSNESKAPSPAVTPILNEPKATREAYSLEAFNRKSSEVKPVVESKAAEPKPVEAKPDAVGESKVTPVIDDENLNWIWPTQGKVIAGFNDASSKGIDIGGTMGQAVNAAAAGKVIYAGSDLRGYGKLVIIKHNKAYLSVYAHNSKILVKEGQVIAAGQKIAEMGNTDSNTTNLHFEIRHQGKSVDPTKYLPQN